jgi:peptidase M42 family hydrolase
MEVIPIDAGYLKDQLVTLLNIPSPSGYTDQAVHYIGEELRRLRVPFTITRRGAIRATIKGQKTESGRAIAVHLDTLGAMISHLKDNGRLGIAPIGTWSSRFAEGARVTIFTEEGPCRGTVLPLQASGHTHGEGIDHQPINWDNLEIRVDRRSLCQKDLINKGFRIGDYVAFDASPEITPNGFVNARHLDDKAGVAILLAVIQALSSHDGKKLPVTCHCLFTIAEEVGMGASNVLYKEVSEMVVIDNATVAPTQNSWEFGATICMMDNSGPFDYHLTRRLIELCREFDLEYSRDVFRYYRSDCASAIVAGTDTRTALVGFGVDGSHGYERTNLSSLLAVGRLIGLYLQSELIFARDKKELSSLQGFPHQPEREIIQIRT